MMTCRWSRLIGVALCLLALAGPAHGQIASQMIVTGLTNPLAMAVDPLDPSVLFIAEQRGLVRVARGGELLSTPFLDLRDQVTSGGERGLLGIAFEPERGRVFVNFTDRNGHTVIARFRRSTDDPFVADLASRRDLVWPDGKPVIEQPFSNHNGGNLAFGPDGYLYVGLGDGGSGGDPMHLAQDPSSLLGKMLRLDVNVADDDGRGYRVPPDNPFVDGDPVAALGEIWAFGLRNPWRYAFDDPARGGTGALLIADVGQGAREEVDYQPAGAGGLNYGWRLREGTVPHDDRRPAVYQPLTEPIHDYARGVGQSITGGYVYRGAALDPSFVGRYFFADFVSGRIFSFALDQAADGSASANDLREHTEAIAGGTRVGLISSFGVDADGELYLLSFEAGAVLKMVPDTSIVPEAPQEVRIGVDHDVATLTWTAAAGGPRALGYLVETSNTTTRTLGKLDAGDRRGISLTLSPDEPCVRVRAVGRFGASAASARVCLPSTLRHDRHR
jgi:glucose/arabinose dehydrogenase